MLWEMGVVLATALITSGILETMTLASRSRAAAAGSAAATTALTTATPSRLFRGALDCSSTACALEALTPPMQTVGTWPWPAAARAVRMSETPAGPMMAFVSFLLGEMALVRSWESFMG